MQSRKIMATGFAIMAVGASMLGISNAAQAANPVPVPRGLVHHPYSQGWTGAQLAKAFVSRAPNQPGNCDPPNVGGIHVIGSTVKLVANGPGCLYLQSPKPMPTLDGYVYEEKINIQNWIAWSAFWGYGNNWPTDGEIDAIEASPTGTNNVSYHYGNPPNGSQVSTWNNTIHTPSNAQALAEGLQPGTHTIDFAFGRCGAGCGAVSVWYDGREVSLIKGNFVLDGGRNNDPFWIIDSTGQPETGTGNGSITIDYLRVFK